MENQATEIVKALLQEVTAAVDKATAALLRADRPPAGSIVPLYSRPMTGAALSVPWRAVIAAKLAHPTVPVVVVANPHNGPGAAIDPSYATGISEAVKAGIVVAGYVPTKYGVRPAAEVNADIDRWRRWYPEAKGVFLDEMLGRGGGEDYYRAAGKYAKENGHTMTIGNPGADTIPSYVDTLDTLVICERAALPAASQYEGNQRWHMAHPRDKFALLAYGVRTLDVGFVMAAKQAVGWIFVNDDFPPNPWDNMPAYFDKLLGALAA